MILEVELTRNIDIKNDGLMQTAFLFSLLCSVDRSLVFRLRYHDSRDIGMVQVSESTSIILRRKKVFHST